MKRLFLFGFFALVLSACAAAPASAPAPAPSVPSPPVAAPVPQAPPPAPPPPAPSCRAAEFQHLVGRPRSEIPVPTDPSRQRVACTTCPVTQDYREDRLNFFFDADTGIVKEVRCG